MFTPLPLRLWCMATMAPALTEAATQARAKLSNREGNTSESTLSNTRVLTPSQVSSVAKQEDLQVIRQTHIISFEKELVTAGIIEPNNGAPKGPPRINLGALKGLTGGLRKPTLVELPDRNHIESNQQATMNLPASSAPTIRATMTPKQAVDLPTVTSKPHTAVNGIGRPKMTTNGPVTNSSNTVMSTIIKNHVASGSKSASSHVVEAADNQQNTSVTAATPSTSSVKVEVKIITPAQPVKADVSARQRDLERKADRLLRRLRRLQSRQAISHIKSQLSGFVDHQHKNLQTMAKSMKTPSPSTSMDLKTELLQSEDVKSLSTAALVNLVRKLQSSQALSLRQRLAHQQATNEGGSSVLRLDEDLCLEMNRVAGTLQMNLHHLETAVDSDATESSSGGESCEDDYEFDYDNASRASLHRRAEWKWTTNRAAVAARWTWLQAQVSDLEYRIRQQSDIYRQIRTTKGAVTLGEVPPPEDLSAKLRPANKTGRKLSPLEEKLVNLERKNEMSPCNLSMLLTNVDKQSSRLTQQLGNVYSPAGSPLVTNRTLPAGQVTPASSACSTPSKLPPTPNGFVDPNGSQGPCSTPEDSDAEGETSRKKARVDGQGGMSFDPPSPALDNTCQAARCRPVKSYGKRKLLRTRGVHQLGGRKASRLSNIKCHCYPPMTSCAMCGSRYNNVQTIDTDTMSLAERVSLLDASYHPVLSFNHDVSLPIHFGALLKTGEWKHKPGLKMLKPATQRRKKTNAAIGSERVKKYNKRLTKSSTAAMLSSAKIRSKYVEKNRPGGPSTPKQTRAEKRKLKKQRKALQSMGRLSKRSRRRNLGYTFDDDCDDEDDERLVQSLPASTLRDMTNKRRRGESAYDINNIVIPYSMAASTRVEKLQYKEIITPKWRELRADQVGSITTQAPSVVSDNGIKTTESNNLPEIDTPPHEPSATHTALKSTTAKVASPVPSSASEPKPVDTETHEKSNGDNGIKPVEDPNDMEDISDELYAQRHMICEIQEKKRYTTFHNNQKRNRNRHDSSASAQSGSGVPPPKSTPSTCVISGSTSSDVESTVNTPAAVVENSFHPVPAPGSLSSTPPSTPAPTFRLVDDGPYEDAFRRRSGSCSSRTDEIKDEARIIAAAALNNRRRTGSVSTTSVLPSSSSGGGGGAVSGRARGRSQSMGETEIVYEVTYLPWTERSFPLDEVANDQLYKESPYVEHAYVPRRSTRTETIPNVEVEGVPGTPTNSRSVSPGLQSSSSSTIIDDDPDDPEWTVVAENDAKAERRPSIVLKLAKR